MDILIITTTALLTMVAIPFHSLYNRKRCLKLFSTCKLSMVPHTFLLHTGRKRQWEIRIFVSSRLAWSSSCYIVGLFSNKPSNNKKSSGLLRWLSGWRWFLLYLTTWVQSLERHMVEGGNYRSKVIIRVSHMCHEMCAHTYMHTTKYTWNR